MFVQLLPYFDQADLDSQWDFADPMTNESSGRTGTVLPVLLCPSATITQNPFVKSSGARYALTSYGGNGGTQSHPPASTSGDGLFAGSGPPITTPPTVQHPLVRLRDITDGTTSTILLGERSHFDRSYDSFYSNGMASNPMTGWGFWAPSGGQMGLTDVTMSSFGPLNYEMSFDFATKPGAISSAATFDASTEATYRVCSFGSQHVGGAHIALADGSARIVSEDMSSTVFRALTTRAGGEVVGDY